MALNWDRLEALPEWRSLIAELTEQQSIKLRELFALAKVSPDPRVRGVAMELDKIEFVVLYQKNRREEEAEAAQRKAEEAREPDDADN